MTIRIARDVLALVRAEAGRSHPHECCGLLFGSADHVRHAQPAPNVAQDPARHFEVDPAVLVAAFRAERMGGARLIGCYHNHPDGPARPSRQDSLCAAPDGRLWLIAGTDGVTLWRADRSGPIHGRFTPCPWQAAD